LKKHFRIRPEHIDRAAGQRERRHDEDDDVVDHAGGARVSAVLGGMGAVAIGLNLATAVRLARRNITGLLPMLITAVITVSIGILGFSLVHVLLVMLPVSLVAAWVTRSP